MPDIHKREMGTVWFSMMVSDKGFDYPEVKQPRSQHVLTATDKLVVDPHRRGRGKCALSFLTMRHGGAI